MPNRTLDVDRVKALAERLKRTRRLTNDAQRRGDDPGQDAWQVATALSDIEESATKLFQELVPRLLVLAPESDEADGLVNDIGEEYRHILYHIRDTKLFSYLFADA